MNYWNEMNTKYGFDEGMTVPPDAIEVRRVYIGAVNLLAEKRGSNIRVVAYHGWGSKNWCLVLLVTADEYNQAEPKKRYDDSWKFEDPWVEPAQDDGFKKALADAREMELDQYVETTTITHTDKLSVAMTNHLASINAG